MFVFYSLANPAASSGECAHCSIHNGASFIFIEDSRSLAAIHFALLRKLFYAPSLPASKKAGISFALQLMSLCIHNRTAKT
jgi:hypothetical protein